MARVVDDRDISVLDAIGEITQGTPEIGYAKVKPGINDIERHDAKQGADRSGIMGGIRQLDGLLIGAVADYQGNSPISGAPDGSKRASKATRAERYNCADIVHLHKFEQSVETLTQAVVGCYPACLRLAREMLGAGASAPHRQSP